MVKLLRDSYSNPPIIEVAWELRYGLHIDLHEVIDQFTEKINDEYPIRSNIINDIYDVNLQNNPTISRKNDFDQNFGWQFSDINKKNILTVSSRNFAIMTREHTNFTNFFENIKSLLDSFIEILDVKNVKFISRLGLRYVNVIDLPDNKKEKLMDYVHLPIDLEIIPIRTISDFTFDILQKFNSYNLKTSYRSILTEELPKILLDLDCFIVNFGRIENKKLSDQIINETSKMHNIIKEKFEQSITDKFITEIMEMV